MLCYYNVPLSKNRGKLSRFPERHWVASSMIYALYPTTFFQLGVYCSKSKLSQNSNLSLSRNLLGNSLRVGYWEKIAHGGFEK